ncbi:MAG: DUF3187 family protein [Gammaproteobacteria bacterium]
MSLLEFHRRFFPGGPRGGRSRVRLDPLAILKAAFYIGALVAIPSAGVRGQDQSLFSTSDGNPFIQIYSLPSPAAYPAPAPRRWAWRFGFDLASSSITEERPTGERIVMDGETYRTSISLDYGLSERLAIGIAVPLVAHSGGFLDGFVQDWHDLFSLSNERREDFEDDSLDYSYVENGVEMFGLRDRDRGLGDIRLTTDWDLQGAPDATRSLVLRSGLKLPTGSSDTLRGSGSTDLSLQLLSTDRQTLDRWGMTLSWMIGGLWLGNGDVLAPLREDLVAIGSIGLSRPIWRRLSARLQLDGHSAFYDSELRPLGASSVQLTFGGSIELARARRIDFAMVQNLFTDTTPDLGIHLAWRGGY